ncbi:ABC transporter ATP-binding protein [Xanthomonas sp. AmX2]|uniref:ABC transporter ATP-binding protein n=1 Tax=Xanthomonas sp. TaxID=29446 RepID=UPI001980DE52|nr:ATP-binding cassette domain-containing protein [Xanthomonas sp.]MBN6151869.1 ABC transporter ATP-binding protein [Xanthomonas sp.]
MSGNEVLVRADNLCKRYGGAGPLHSPTPLAVDRVSFGLAAGETLALVGESGSGKSSVGRLLLRLEQATSGEVHFEGRALGGLGRRELRPLRQRMQMIFQDPYSALDPRMRVGEFVAEPLQVHRLARGRGEREQRVAELFRQVGLDPALMQRWPHQFSGGQRQRIAIARAIALQPRFIVADEPITALDVSIQAQIVNLLQDIQQHTGVAYLFISHDLSMVQYLSRRVAVMRAGRIVELAPTAQLFEDPRHPYTQALLSAVPVADPRVERTRRRIDFDPARHAPATDAALREVAPGHWVLQ